MKSINKHPQGTFPVEEILPELLKALSLNNRCILIAPPGAGKTTIVPPALLNAAWLVQKKIIMLEPRRIAARRSAEFMAECRGERCGQTIGYRIRMESVVGPETLIEVVTEGVLTRMLQGDAELPGTGLVIFDEYHERSIHADTGLALALDVQKNIRPDLKILIMSATPDKEKLLQFFGSVPVIESGGKMFPVSTHYLTHPSDKRLEVRTAEAVMRALRKDTGDILVFLPGKAEIKRTRHLLEDAIHTDDCTLHELHGSATRAEQDAALRPAETGKRKIILATSIAETSLTIDGVRVVIDSGVSRVSNFSVRRGMAGLITVPVSRATADQRRGRAGRLEEGVCYRLWTRQDDMQHPEHTQPEIITSDLTSLALELAQWGTPHAEGLAFPDPPPPEMLSYAIATLHTLGATDKSGRLNDFGKKMNRLPLHPRYSAMLLRAIEHNLANEACLLAAMLEENSHGTNKNTFDLQEQFETYLDSSSANNRGASHVFEYAHKLEKLAGIPHRSVKDINTGFLLAIAYPERVAKRQTGNKYQLAQGMVVTIPEDSRLMTEEYLVITDVDGASAVGKAFGAAVIDKEEILSLFRELLVNEEVVNWIDNAVRGKQRTKFGVLSLREKDFNPTDTQAQECLFRHIRANGLSFLNFGTEGTRFIERSEWCRLYVLNQGDEAAAGWPVLTPEALLATLEQWLAPFLAGIRKKKDIDALHMAEVLQAMFSYEQLHMLDRLAPDTITVPGGSRIQIHYNQGEKPLLAVRLQELFGQIDTPSVGGGRVPLLIHMLSPAHRPLAITQDLRSFWVNTYPEVLGQMRRKYPRHVWPDDPLSAAPTNKTKRFQKR